MPRLYELALEAKVENILQYRQGVLSDAEAIKAESDRLRARADALMRRAEWLKGYIHQALVNVGVAKLSTVAKSPPKVELAEGAEIPERYRCEVVSVSLDKAAVMSDHKVGVPLPEGVSVTQSTYLRIS
jgi:hypothetical protein